MRMLCFVSELQMCISLKQHHRILTTDILVAERQREENEK